MQKTANAIIITANLRLKKIVSEQYNRSNIKNIKSWQTLPIYSWNEWQLVLWQQLANNFTEELPLLLNKYQQHFIWQKIINNDLTMPLLRANSVAELSNSALELLSQWQLNLDKNDDNTDDVQAFNRWSQEFIKICKNNNYLSQNNLITYFITNIVKLALPKKIILRGFLEFTPLQQNFLDLLSTKNIIIESQNLSYQANTVQRTVAATTNDEFIMALEWAKNHYHNNNQAYIGIVIPNLTEHRSEILMLANKLLSRNSFNIAAPKALSSYAMVATALKILNGAKAQVSLKKTTAEVWLKIIINLLTTANWLDLKKLSAEEVQLYNKWQDLYQQYLKLDLSLGQHSYYEALQALNYLANKITFLSRAPDQAQIHIVGVLEALGTPFDYLWLTDCSQNNWPNKVSLQPFIATKLQQQLNMPRSSAERELQVATNIINTLKQGAKHEVIISYPHSVDNNIMQPCRLIIDLAIVQFTNAAQNKVAKTMVLEKIIDNNYVPLNGSEQVSRGVKSLQLQASCPFRGFAQLRLRATVIEPEVLGFSALERGNMLHLVLAQFWIKIKSQENLVKLSSKELARTLEELVHKSLTVKYSKSYLKLEKLRIIKLLTDWLEIEKNKAEFKVIAVEQKLKGELANLPFNLRVDRIDQLANGDLVIIDYKTGLCSTKDWFGGRPNEPQLLLYYLLYQPQAKNIAFAIVRKDKMQLITTASDPNWQTILEQLAIDFQQGIATVDPKYSATTCRICHLKPLCRING